MTRAIMGEGERAEARRRGRMRVVVALGAVAGITIIALTALFKQGHGRLTAEGAGAIAAFYVIAMVGIGWRSSRLADEVENRANHRALALAACAYILAYPVWYFLWRGGLVLEPRHDILFVGVMTVAMFAYALKKIG